MATDSDTHEARQHLLPAEPLNRRKLSSFQRFPKTARPFGSNGTWVNNNSSVISPVVLPVSICLISPSSPYGRRDSSEQIRRLASRNRPGWLPQRSQSPRASKRVTGRQEIARRMLHPHKVHHTTYACTSEKRIRESVFCVTLVYLHRCQCSSFFFSPK